MIIKDLMRTIKNWMDMMRVLGMSSQNSSWALHILQLETIVIIRLNVLRTIFYEATLITNSTPTTTFLFHHILIIVAS